MTQKITKKTTLSEVVNIDDYELCEGPMNCFGEYVGSWIDCGDVWLNISEQGTSEWLNSRKGRVTASDFGAAAGVSRFTSREELLIQKSTGVEKEFSEAAKKHMARGTKNEPVARNCYIRNTGSEVVERGLVVPKWNPLIGASVDGDVLGTKGCIEIKCPEYIYGPLREHEAYGGNGEGHGHIWETHYCQMQGGAAIYGKKWFDYVVFGVVERKVYIERVDFDRDYWFKFLYPKLESFTEELRQRV